MILAAALLLLCGCRRAPEPVAEKPADPPAAVDREKYIGKWKSVQRGNGFDEDTVFYVGFDGTGFMRTMLLFDGDRPTSIITMFDWSADNAVLRATTRQKDPDIPPSTIDASVQPDGVLAVRPAWRPGVELRLMRVVDDLMPAARGE